MSQRNYVSVYRDPCAAIKKESFNMLNICAVHIVSISVH